MIHLLLFLLLLFAGGGELDAEVSSPSVLFLYHPSKLPPPDKLSAEPQLSDNGVIIANILGHFDSDLAMVPVEKYFYGMMKPYQYVFYIGDLQGAILPKAFLDDIPKYSKVTVVWIRWNIERLLDGHATHFGFRVSPPRGGFNQLIYNHSTYERPDTEMIPPAEIANWDAVQMDGILKSRTGFTGFMIHSKNLWYFPDAVFRTNTTPYLVFCDMLHEVFRAPHQVLHRFFVRLEDIHPLRDPGKLRANCETLAKSHTPFMMGIVVQYRAPQKARVVYLKEKPHLVQAIRDCAAWGGSVLLHGYSHQYQDETGEGHEFWDVERDRPIAEYTESTVREKMEKGIQALTELGLYPIGWETPHYAATQENYRIFADYFSIAVEQRQISNRTYRATQGFPFIVRDLHGQTILPENLGFINFETGETIEKKIQNAIPYKIVRDSVVGVFYHPYFDPKYLRELVDKLAGAGFKPLDLREVPGVVVGEDLAVFSGLESGPRPFKPLKKIAFSQVDYGLIKMKTKRKWLHSFSLDFEFRTTGERWLKVQGEGWAVFEVPSQAKRIFVVEATDEKPEIPRQMGQFLRQLILGKTRNPLETVERWIVWVLFLLTLVALVLLVKVLISRTNFHESHFRKKT